MSRTGRDAVAFLQWALPRLGLRWTGFRKVRRQVVRRIVRRLGELGLADLDTYRAYLETHPEEWRRLDLLCRVTISRFYRDRGVFWSLREHVLPALAEAARRRGGMTPRAWCAGSASGEEPYSLRLAWDLDVGPGFPGLAFEIVASETDPHLLERAEGAVYPSSSLREIPAHWRDAFTPRTAPDGETLYALDPRLRTGITWRREDVRDSQPDGPFDLVLCRNLAFTYFGEAARRAFLERLLERLIPGGALVVGTHETPPELDGLEPWAGCPRIWRRKRDTILQNQPRP